jgi:hypothetical protein
MKKYFLIIVILAGKVGAYTRTALFTNIGLGLKVLKFTVFYAFFSQRTKIYAIFCFAPRKIYGGPRSILQQ